MQFSRYLWGPALWVIAIAPAAAQDVSPSAAKSDRAGSNVIVVTAQKREQNLQEVAVTITAFSGDELRELGATDSTALAEFVPNLEIGDPVGAGSQPAIFIRGVGLNDFNTNNAGPNGVYVDEVYISAPSSQAFQLFDVERVEVLRGPQGTLYGRNTTGGAINFVTRRPSDVLEGNVNVTYGSFNTFTADGGIGGPLNDSVRLRASGQIKASDGYVDNLTTGNTLNGSTSFAGRLLLDIDLSPDAELRLNVHGGELDAEVPQYRSQGLIDPATETPCGPGDILAGICGDAFAYISPADFRDGNFNREGDLNATTWGGSATLNWDVGAFDIVSITAFEYLDRLQEEESDASPNQLLEVDFGVKSQTFTQELRLVGEGPRLNWLAGAYYLWEDLDQDQSVDLFRSLRPLAEAADPEAFPGGFDPMGVTNEAPIFFANTRSNQGTESFAIYGQVEYELTDQLAATLGGRFTTESRDFTSALNFIEPGFTVPIFTFAGDISEDDFSWRFALDYQATDDLLLYASYSTGFKSGGFNGGPVVDPVALEPFDSEKLAAYEIGFKSQFADRRATLNAAAFYYDYSDLQVFTLINSGGLPLPVLDNAADATIWGFEAELALEPVDNLNINASMGYLNTKLEDFVTGTGADFSGNRLALAPEVSASARIAYDYDVGSGLIRTQLNASWRSSVFFSTENNPLISQGDYALVGARIKYVSPDAGWHVAVFGENLTDHDYLSYATDFSDFGFNQQVVTPGRFFGVELGLDF